MADQKFPKSASYQDFFAAADSFVEPFLRTLAELTSFHSLTYPHFFLVAMSRIQDIPTRMTRNKHTSAPLLSSRGPAEAQSPRSLMILESAALGLSLLGRRILF